MAFSEKESETDSEYSDDSQEDPNFDVLEETRLTLSNLSLKRKSKSLETKGTDEKEDKVELDEQDQKSYEIIRKIIEGGKVDRLKVDECKLYLRKHGLRLSGNKETLTQRIMEHIDIVSGGGEKKYPASSFVLNCQGDACTGDVVMFDQNVYEEYSVASRSSKGGPCGRRVVAGRILKESYGAAKQQHTFTIEVLWSRGEKPLPPLYPLLIKGRNLYRLKTMRQKWEDEGERQRILLEKHARGGAARLNREARIQQREMRKSQKQTSVLQCTKSRQGWISENQICNPFLFEESREPLDSAQMNPDKQVNQRKQEQQQPKVHCYTTTSQLSISVQPVNLQCKPNHTSNIHILPVYQRQYIGSKSPTRVSYDEQQMNYRAARSPIRGNPSSLFPNSNLPVQRNMLGENQGSSSMRSPLRGLSHGNVRPYPQQSLVMDMNRGSSSIRSLLCGVSHENVHPYPQPIHVMNLNRGSSSMRSPLRRFNHENVRPYSQQSHMLNAARNAKVEQKCYEQKQKCRYFVQGRCHFGDRCKYLHE